MNATPSFADANAAALAQYPHLLESWLPGGRLEGREYVCGDLTGAPGESCKVNVETGLWSDFATGDSGNDPVSLYAAIHGMKPGEARRELAEALKVPGKGNSGTSKTKRQEWAAILPIPADASTPSFEHYRHGKPSATWEYRDHDGNALGHACRFDSPDGGKDVLPLTYCRGPEGRKEWRWQGFPEPRPLYGLDALAQVKADAGTLLVEGEKTADAATRLRGPGKVCMTWPGGCKAVGKVDLSPLAGRPVSIWPDADKPGFDAALALAGLLKSVGASSVAIIVPPAEAAQGWDLADAEAEGWTADKVTAWLRDNSTTPERFQEIAQERFSTETMLGPEAAPTSKHTLHIVNVADLLTMELPERGYVLYPVIKEQGTAMLYAPRGLGKTWAALSVAYAVASGQSVFGSWKAPVPRRVLYLDGEMPASTMKERLASIIAGYDGEPPDADYLRILTPDLQPDFMPNIATQEGQADLAPFLEDVDLVVVDNIATLGRNGRENETEGWLPVQEWALRLRRAGKSVLFIHHAGKGGNQRGTSAREDILDTVIAMRRPGDYRAEEGARFEVHLEKSRGFCGPEAKPFEAALRLDNDVAGWTTRQIEDVELDRVKALKAEGLTVRDIAEETGLSRSKVGRIIKGLERGQQ